MIISSIKPARGHIVEITADGEVFVFDKDDAARFKEGDELPRDELLRLCEESEKRRAKSRALWYLSRGDLSKKALKEKLCRAFSDNAAEYAVARMEELSLICDRRYAYDLASRLSAQNASDREIVQRLYGKGISFELAREAVSSLQSDPEARIAALIEKKYKRSIETEEGVKKTTAALMRKGFSFGDIKRALARSEFFEDSEEY